MLRIGHKYAFRPDIRRSLSQLVTQTDEKLGQRICNLSSIEKTNWNKWKLSVIKEITTLKQPPKPVERSIMEGIKDLKSMEIVIKQADKNLGLVPIRGDYYAAMLRKWLTPPGLQPVNVFPHADILRRMQNTTRKSHAISPEQKVQWYDYAQKHTEPSPFYTVPKIHKKDKLGSRPISAQHSYMLSPLSIALTKVLMPIQDGTRGITKDSKSFVRRIEELRITEPFVFLTYDVEKCYPNIDLNDAINTLHQNVPVMREHYGFWTKILQIIMYNNYVTANGQIYRQMTGTATGTQVAPPFANLYLHHKFKSFLSDPAILLHERYIDDGFLLVKTREDAVRIVTQLNQATNLNLTYDIDEHKAIFLDLEIYKGPRFKLEGRLDLRTHFKPTNRLLYLPMVSNHPKAMKKGIIIGEAIRTLRNSSDKAEWLKALQFIFKGLLARGYPPAIIKEAWKKVRWEERDYYVLCDSGTTPPPGPIILTRFNPETKTHWKNLLAKYPFENVFPKRNLKWNKKQLAIIQKWPPTIVWSKFKKIGHNTISAKERWEYPSKRRRETEDDSRRKRQRLY